MNLYFNIILSSDSGIERALIGGLSALFVFFIIWVVSTTKEKVAEVRFKYNPDDAKLLEKFALEDMKKGDYNNAQIKLEKLLEIDKNNFTSLVYLSVIYYGQQDYERSKKLLFYYDDNFDNLNITIDLLRRDTEASALAYFYLSHFYNLDGKTELSEEKKKIALNLKEDIETFAKGWETKISSDKKNKEETEIRNHIKEEIIEEKNKSYKKTSDEALTELKRAKDKLDLELINQEEYDKIKEELRVYIK